MAEGRLMQELWIPTFDESALQEGTATPVTPKGVSILLIRKEGRLYALRNRCAHMGCTLAGGRLDGNTLQCPCHEWKYDITTGEFLNAREITIQTYACKSQNGRIFIQLEES
jgi:nitrite reductase/ring-hydroxylating ferredoxin subunit